MWNFVIDLVGVLLLVVVGGVFMDGMGGNCMVG